MNLKTVILSAAIVAMSIGNSYAQDGAPLSGTSCATGNCGVVDGYFNNGFSYSGCGTGSCGEAQRFSGGYGGFQRNWRADWHQLKQEDAMVRARNQAWPKPFDCADRQLYFSIWEPMLDAGYQKHCTLTQAHFDSDTGDLNSYGRSAVAGIMQNMPNHRKTIFVHRDVDEAISDARMEVVRNVVQTWYSNQGNATVAFTNDLPSRSMGGRIETINNLYQDGTPPPTIPVASGDGGVDGG